MRTPLLLLGISSLLLAACGDDSGGKAQDAGPQDGITIHDTTPTPDAPPVDADPSLSFSCYQNTAPTTADATVTISGKAQQAGISGTSPLANAHIKFCKGDCLDANMLGTTDSDAQGNYTSTALTTGGTPLAAYIVADAIPDETDHSKDLLKTFVFPHAALAASFSGAPIAMVPRSTLDLLSNFGMEQDPANGIIALVVTDCAMPYKGVTGATITLTKAGAQVGDDAFDIGGFQADAAGTYLITNVPPGAIHIVVTYAGMTFLASDVTVEADANTTGQIRPGY